MGKYIIDTQSGTMVNAEYCYIVDDNDITEDLNPMSDSELSELANRVGTSLMKIGIHTGWGDNAYAFSVSYSPLSIKDETLAYLESGVYEEDELEYKACQWASEAPIETLELASAYCMADNSVWEGYREHLMSNLMDVYRELHDLDSK